MTAFDVAALRAEFPILARAAYGKPLVYLDNAASAQKPLAVIDAMRAAMEGSYANVHRGLHLLANETTTAFEKARATIAAFVNAASPDEIAASVQAAFASLAADGCGKAASGASAPPQPASEAATHRAKAPTNPDTRMNPP